MMTTVWDQNAGLRALAPAATAADDAVGRWALELLGLPGDAVVGLVPGGMSASFTALAAARTEVLRRAGWDLDATGSHGAPRVHVLANADRHEAVDRALRFLGLGRPGPGRHRRARPGRPRRARGRAGRGAGRGAAGRQPVRRPHQHRRVRRLRHPRPDGPRRAAAGSTSTARSGCGPGRPPRLRHLVDGVGLADSWATDAHKTLNVPYDCGLAVVADPRAMSAAMSMHADYMITDAAQPARAVRRAPPSGPGGPAGSRRGRPCARSAGRGSPTSSTGCTRRRSPWPPAWPASTA